MCTHRITLSTSYHTTICKHCGVERSVPLTNVVEYTDTQPLILGYSRKKRFRNITMALFFPYTHSILSSEVCHALQNEKKFTSVKALVQCIKRVRCTNKQYQSIHLYATAYVKNFARIEPPSRNIIDNINGDFVVLERG